jgi:hypothetical protein
VEALLTQTFSVCFKSVHIACCYECPQNRVDVFERGITLPGRAEVTLSATMPGRLQESTALQLCEVKVCLRTGHEGPERV